MGMKHPSPVLGEVTNCSISTSHPVERSYYQQIYLRHRKTSAEFREEVTSIAKRTAYLHYPWAQKLQATLEKASNHHLYSRYKSLLKENCTLNGKDQKIMCAASVRNLFHFNFAQSKQDLQKNPSFSRLSILMTECKCYIMVLTWLHRLATLQNESHTEEEGCSNQKEGIYSELLVLGEKCWQVGSKEKEQTFNVESVSLDRRLWVLLEAFKGKMTFGEIEFVMTEIEALLSPDQPTLLGQMRVIESKLGRCRVLSHILTVQQMGGSSLPRIEGYLALRLRQQ